MTKRERREYEETNNKKIDINTVLMIVLIMTCNILMIYIGIFCKNKTNNELFKVEYNEYEVFDSYGEFGMFKKYDYTTVIKIENDKYLIFEVTEFIPGGADVIIKSELYSNGDEYASILGVNCKKILIEKGD